MADLYFLIYPLMMTLAAELLIACILGVRGLRQYVVIAVMNIITNPLINITLRIVSDKMDISRAILYFLIFVLEIAVVLIEGCILQRFTRKLPMKPYPLSLILNLSSFAAGVLSSVMLNIWLNARL